MDRDERYMRHALALGRRSMGATAENPAVGCVIVAKDGAPAGLGWTAGGGRPHAETRALAMAGDRTRGATAYVTLEPCSHHGRTPPCADALIDAGVERCVIALADPDPRVTGQGIARLREAGIAVDVGTCASRAVRDLAGYLSRKRNNRPHVLLKLAISADDMIAAKRGERIQITGREAANFVHLLRARCDGILVGVSTVIADDPVLTCRLPGLAGRSPVRLVSDSRLTTPLEARVVQTAHDVPTWILTCAGPDSDKARALSEAGVILVQCAATSDGKVDLHNAMNRLAGRGLNTVLAEGGAHMARALLEVDLVDEAVILTAPHSLGPDGLHALAGLPLTRISDGGRFRATARWRLGNDIAARYERANREKPMFTGIVTDIGEVLEVRDAGDRRIEIACAYDRESIDMGASICCGGVCLTVVDTRKHDDGRTVFSVDVSAETLAATALGDWQIGSRINLERSLKLGDELGGHVVSGHVDGVARVLSVTPEGASMRIRIEAPEGLARFVAPKGSIALDGTSFTVNEVEGSAFGINVIPHTQAVTTWGNIAEGDRVNVEIDMLARYVARLATFHKPAGAKD